MVILHFFFREPTNTLRSPPSSKKMMVLGRLRPDRKSKYGTKSGRPKVPRHEEVDGTRAQSHSKRNRASTSLLEQLPTELLHDIFLFSANLHLPLCSNRLLSALTSQHLKFEITLQILVFQRDRLDQESKSLLLSRRFFTWDFLVRYISFSQPRIAVAYDEDDSEDERPTAQERPVGSAPSHTTTSQASVPSLRELEQNLTNLTHNGIADMRRNEISHLVEIDLSDTPAFDQLHRNHSLPGLRNLNIPLKLFRNDGDDDRLRLLRLLLIFGCTLDPSLTASIAAENAILAAIEQGDEELVSYYLGAQIRVEPTVEMLRRAFAGNNLSIVFQLLRAGDDGLDRLDPLVWRLLDEHMLWTKDKKTTVKRWLKNEIPSAVTETDAEFLPRLKSISVNVNRWAADE